MVRKRALVIALLAFSGVVSAGALSWVAIQKLYLGRWPSDESAANNMYNLRTQSGSLSARGIYNAPDYVPPSRFKYEKENLVHLCEAQRMAKRYQICAQTFNGLVSYGQLANFAAKVSDYAKAEVVFSNGATLRSIRSLEMCDFLTQLQNSNDCQVAEDPGALTTAESELDPLVEKWGLTPEKPKTPVTSAAAARLTSGNFERSKECWTELLTKNKVSIEIAELDAFLSKWVGELEKGDEDDREGRTEDEGTEAQSQDGSTVRSVRFIPPIDGLDRYFTFKTGSWREKIEVRNAGKDPAWFSPSEFSDLPEFSMGLITVPKGNLKLVTGPVTVSFRFTSLPEEIAQLLAKRKDSSGAPDANSSMDFQLQELLALEPTLFVPAFDELPVCEMEELNLHFEAGFGAKFKLSKNLEIGDLALTQGSLVSWNQHLGYYAATPSADSKFKKIQLVANEPIMLGDIVRFKIAEPWKIGEIEIPKLSTVWKFGYGRTWVRFADQGDGMVAPEPARELIEVDDEGGVREVNLLKEYQNQTPLLTATTGGLGIADEANPAFDVHCDGWTFSEVRFQYSYSPPVQYSRLWLGEVKAPSGYEDQVDRDLEPQHFEYHFKDKIIKIKVEMNHHFDGVIGSSVSIKNSSGSCNFSSIYGISTYGPLIFIAGRVRDLYWESSVFGLYDPETGIWHCEASVDKDTTPRKCVC